MDRVLIIGAGPQARIIPDIVAACDNLELLGFVDVANERRFLRGDASHFTVYDGNQFPAEMKTKLGDFSVLIGNDNIELRPELITQINEAGLPLANIIHPSAIISPSAKIGSGILMAPGIIIGPGAEIGDHVILNTAVTLDHDSQIEDNVIIGPAVHLAGGVKVGSGSYVGIGVCSVGGVSIGSNSLIGAGSVITKDIPDNVVAVGVPAKVIRTRE